VQKSSVRDVVLVRDVAVRGPAEELLLADITRP
jgi:hypothetical protein